MGSDSGGKVAVSGMLFLETGAVLGLRSLISPTRGGLAGRSPRTCTWLAAGIIARGRRLALGNSIAAQGDLIRPEFRAVSGSRQGPWANLNDRKGPAGLDDPLPQSCISTIMER